MSQRIPTAICAGNNGQALAYVYFEAGRFAELHERYRGLDPFGGEDYAHPDHGGHTYNGDIAMAARCAHMTLDDALWRCRDSQMRARQ
jgi:hypothetical protein